MYKIADFAVLPSVWDDSAPLTVIEALTCGLPLITTNSGGIPEYATKDSSIILDRYDNLVDNLAKNIDELLLNDKKRQDMKKAAINASKKLTINEYYNNLISYLK